MAKKKSGRRYLRLPPHKKLPDREKRLPKSASILYNRIYTFGVAGCWMSNATLARQLDYCTKTIKRARKLLIEEGCIFTARTLPRTWSCWAKTHPAVKKKAILYYKGGYIDNPFYENPEAKSVGVQNVPSEGSKCPLSRKNGVAHKGYIPKGDSDKGSRLVGDTDDGKSSELRYTLTGGGALPPHAPPAGRLSVGRDLTARERFDKLLADRKRGKKKHGNKNSRSPRPVRR